MPTEFQRIMEEILNNIANVYNLIDDILIVTKGTKEEHEEKVREFEKNSRKIIQLKEDKCKIVQNESEWLEFDISEKRVKPHKEKKQDISG